MPKVWVGGLLFGLAVYTIHQDKGLGCRSLKNYLSLICDDAESHTIYQHVVLVFISLLVCTIIWACVLLYCVTDLHVLQQTAFVSLSGQ